VFTLVILRDLILEFGFAEALDSLLVRPLALYTSLQWISNMAIALLLGKVVADVVFYVPTVVAFEVRERRAAHKSRQ
jgi:hypothetical protein